MNYEHTASERKRLSVKEGTKSLENRQKWDLTEPLDMAGYKRSCLLLPSCELGLRSQMGQPELTTDPNTLICPRKPTGGMACFRGEPALPHEMGFPNS